MIINNWTINEDNYNESLQLPADHLTYNSSISLAFENINYIDNLWVIDGYKFKLHPELIYKVNYQSWGNENQLIRHNQYPGLRFSILLAYYKQLWFEHNLRLESGFFTGLNLYKRELWSMGKDILNNPIDHGISGFYSGEFNFNTGWLFNFYYSLPLITQSLRTYLKYDLFHNIDTNSLFHGMGIGLLLRLPIDIELALQLGLGLNAQRAEGPGLELDFVLSKIFNL